VEVKITKPSGVSAMVNLTANGISSVQVDAGDAIEASYNGAYVGWLEGVTH
jgi:hypothetical protein